LKPAFAKTLKTSQQGIIMKITLNKASLVNLSNDDKIIPGELTPLVVGGKVDENAVNAATRYCGELTANANTCPSDRTGQTRRCCQIP